MDTTYAYYFQGTIAPPKVDETFAYLGTQPFGEVGVRIEGYATVQWSSGNRHKIVDTLAFPGFAVKGLAAAGPTLDIFGEVSLLSSHN
jgi:hypothetical protein